MSSVPTQTTTQAPLAVLSDTTTFTVATGPNPNYPNPDRWGLSYHINGEESPVLLLKRGVEYTFVITAGEFHPFYLTDDIVGGRGNPDETVYAGSEDAHGTPESPYVLRFTPTEAHPDLMYYQCWFHQRLGWKVLLDSNVADGTSTQSADATTAGGTSGSTTGLTTTATSSDVSRLFFPRPFRCSSLLASFSVSRRTRPHSLSLHMFLPPNAPPLLCPHPLSLALLRNIARICWPCWDV